MLSLHANYNILLFFSLKVVDISDEVTDVEMSNNENEEKGVIISEVNIVTSSGKKQQQNNKDTRVSQIDEKKGMLSCVMVQPE